MRNEWRESVEEKRDTLEAWAATDLPLADDVAELLERADAAATDDEAEVATA